MPSNVIILAGPGGDAFNRENILKAEEGFKKVGLKTSVIGDGKVALAATVIDDRLLPQVASSDGQTMLFIMAHGDIDKRGNHVINLTGEYTLKISELFDKLKKIGKPVDIFSTACHGGEAHLYAQSKLPSGSTYVSLAPTQEPVSGFDVDRLIAVMGSGKVINSSLTAEQLAMLYLTKALQNRIIPSISTPNSSHDLNSKLVSHLGIKFTDLEKASIYDSLQPLVEKSVLDKMITRIESASSDWDISAVVFGLSLAICHAASGKMLVKKSLFEVNTQSIASVESLHEQVSPSIIKKESKSPTTDKKIHRQERCLSFWDSSSIFNPRAGGEMLKMVRNKGLFTNLVLPIESMAAPKINRYNPSSFVSVLDRESKRKQQENGLESKVAKKLSLLLEKTCNLISLLSDWHIIKISPDQSYEAMKSYADILTSAGLSVDVKEALILDNGFQVCPAKIELRDSLTAALNKLNAITMPMQVSARANAITP
jgi:hypothetical protein